MANSTPLDVELPADDDPDWAWHNVDVYNMGVFDYEGIYIGLPAVYFRRGKRYSKCIVCFTAIELTCSRDLKDWTRLGERQPFIPCSQPGMGAYDLSKNLPPSNAVVRGDELWFYYRGGTIDGPKHTWKYGMGLATLRRDGFASLNADEDDGLVITRPFVFEGKGVAERKYIRVAAATEEGKPQRLGSGPHRDEFGAQFRNSCSYRHLGPAAHSHHGDHRRYTDDDAKKSQARPEFVRTQRPERSGKQ